MSYENYYQSAAPMQRFFKENRFRIYYGSFLCSLVVLAVVVNLIGYPTVAGMLISYIFLFSVVSVLFIFLPIALISYFF